MKLKIRKINMSVIIDDIDMVKNDNDIFDPNNDMETMFLLSQ